MLDNMTQDQIIALTSMMASNPEAFLGAMDTRKIVLAGMEDRNVTLTADQCRSITAFLNFLKGMMEMETLDGG